MSSRSPVEFRVTDSGLGVLTFERMLKMKKNSMLDVLFSVKGYIGVNGGAEYRGQELLLRV
jgi:hypothetical protein